MLSHLTRIPLLQIWDPKVPDDEMLITIADPASRDLPNTNGLDMMPASIKQNEQLQEDKGQSREEMLPQAVISTEENEPTLFCCTWDLH